MKQNDPVTAPELHHGVGTTELKLIPQDFSNHLQQKYRVYDDIHYNLPSARCRINLFVEICVNLRHLRMISVVPPGLDI
jgi:hypothetical protein